jgi:TonB family protein
MLLAAGCVPQRGALAGAPGARPQGCVDEVPAGRVPSAAQLVDTAALAAALRELASEGNVAGRVILTMEFDADGTNVERRILRHDVAPATADSIQRLVFGAVRSGPETGRPWGARLTVEVGRVVRFETESREYCPPRPLDRDLRWAIGEEAAPGPRYRAGRLQRTVLLRVLVHPTGRVQDAQVVRGAVSGGSQERELFDFIRRYTFHPATLDGRPVGGEVTVPVRVRQ